MSDKNDILSQFADTHEEASFIKDYAESKQKTNDIDDNPLTFLEGFDDELEESQSTSARAGKVVSEGLPEGGEEVGVVKDVATQAVGGLRDAGQEFIEFTDSLGNWLNENVADLGEISVGDGTPISLPDVPESNRLGGQITRGAVQFLSGFIPTFKAMKFIKSTSVAGKVGKVLGASSVTDATFFDPHQERLSNFINEYEPLRNPVTEFLAADPSDTEAEGRFKNALEGLGVEAVVGAPLAVALKALRGSKKVIAESLVEDTTSTAIKPVYGSKGPAISDITSRTTQADLEAIDGIKVKVGEKALNINPDKITDEKALQEVLVKTSKFYPEFKDLDVVQTNKQTSTLAKNLGMSVDDLLKRRKGEAFNAQEMVAANNMLSSSLDNLKKLAAKVHTVEGSDLDRMALRRAMDVHAAIQLQVTGLKKEAGRALQAGRIKAKTQATQLNSINELISNRGGRGTIDDLAEAVLKLDDPAELSNFVRRNYDSNGFDMISELWISGLLSSPSTQMLNFTSTASMTALQIPERFLAGAFNKLNKKAGIQGVDLKEGIAMVNSLETGFRYGLQSMKLAWKTEGLLDPVTKVSGLDRRAITAENMSRTFLGKNIVDPVLKGLNSKTLSEGGVAGRLTDGFGTALRGVSTRALVSGDAFFKGMATIMQNSALATRQGLTEGLTGKELDARVKSLMANPSDEMSIGSRDFANEITFTRPNEFSRGVSMFANKHPMFKFVTPFVKVMSNIVAETGKRTPLGLVSDTVRADLSGANGKIAQDMARSRLTMGTSLMGIGTLGAMSGRIIGAMPKDPELRRAFLDANMQEYSFVFFDKDGNREFVPFKNIEPIGPLFGMGADLQGILAGIGEKEAEELIIKASGSFYNHVIDKLWIASVGEVDEALRDPTSRGKRKMEQTLAALIVPNVMNKLNRHIDPFKRDPEGVWETIKSRFPGASQGLPLRRNFIGDPIPHRFSIEADDGASRSAINMIMPGFREAEDPSGWKKEVYENEIKLRMPARTFRLKGASVRLSDKEYNDLLQIDGEVLKTSLESIVESEKYRKASGGPKGGKALLIKSKVTAVRRNKVLQKKFLQRNPDVLERWKIELEKKKQQLQGTQ